MLHERPRPGRVGYVLKMYPRFSETFILTELLALEGHGVDLEVFSLRLPVDGRFHARLADLRAPVSYLSPHSLRSGDVWLALREAAGELGDLGPQLGDLLALDVRDAVAAVELARQVHRRRISHLHAHFASVSADVARLAAKITGITYSFTAHAKDIFHRDVDQAALRRKLRDAHDVITVSDFNLGYLRRTFGSDADQVRRVYNGLDLTALRWRDPTVRPAVIAAVGRLVEKKGFADLIDACAILAGEGRDFRVALIGSGDQEAALRARIARLGLDQRVRLLGGRPQDQVAKIVGSAAALAAPCVVGSDGNRDGLPTVLLEAMALGTPCVATPVTGIPEVIEHERTGLLVAEHDPAGLAAALGRLLDDRRLRSALARRARALVEREFDAEQQARQVAEAFAPSLSPVPRWEGVPA